MEYTVYQTRTNAELQRLLSVAPDDKDLLREIALRFASGMLGYNPSATRTHG